MQLSKMTRASVANTDAPVVIPTYVHVITDDTGKIGNVNATTIRKQIALMNSDFSGRSSATAAKSRFTFKVMRITRTRNTRWHNFQFLGSMHEAMAALRVGGLNALNMYVVNPLWDDGSGVLGWARMPDGNIVDDGIVVAFYTLPGMDTSILGKTAPQDRKSVV